MPMVSCDEQWVNDAQEAFIRAEAAEAKIALARSYHGNSIDPTECIECADGHFPCRTALALDGQTEGQN